MFYNALVFSFTVFISLAAFSNPIHEHARKNEWVIVYAMIDGGANINEVDDETGETIFDIALAALNYDECNMLVMMGAELAALLGRDYANNNIGNNDLEHDASIIEARDAESPRQGELDDSIIWPENLATPIGARAPFDMEDEESLEENKPGFVRSILFESPK